MYTMCFEQFHTPFPLLIVLHCCPTTTLPSQFHMFLYFFFKPTLSLISATCEFMDEDPSTEVWGCILDCSPPRNHQLPIASQLGA